jgi:hypothetical protein
MFKFRKIKLIKIGIMIIEIPILCFLIPWVISDHINPDKNNAGRYIMNIKGMFLSPSTTVGEIKIDLDWPSSVIISKESTDEYQSIYLAYKADLFITIKQFKPHDIDHYRNSNIETWKLANTSSAFTISPKYRIGNDHVFLTYWLFEPDSHGKPIYATNIIIPEKNLELIIFGNNYGIPVALDIIKKLIYGDPLINCIEDSGNE